MVDLLRLVTMIRIMKIQTRLIFTPKHVAISIFTQVTPLTPVDTGIGGSIDLISRNEKTQVTALRNHYEK